MTRTKATRQDVIDGTVRIPRKLMEEFRREWANHLFGQAVTHGWVEPQHRPNRLDIVLSNEAERVVSELVAREKS